MSKKISEFIGLGILAMGYFMASKDPKWTKLLLPKKPEYTNLQGSHYLSIYNQVYHNALVMSIGPTFYYSTIQATIL